MPSFQQTITTPTVCEKTTSQLVFQITDESSAALALAQLTTLTLTLYAVKGGAIINSCTARNIKNANGGTVTSTGLLTLVLDSDDNAMSTQARATEEHVALLEYTWAAGAKSGRKEITFTVVNQTKVS